MRHAVAYHVGPWFGVGEHMALQLRGGGVLGSAARVCACQRLFLAVGPHVPLPAMRASAR
jgi:hypothetical protein